jgi:cobyric acid synthase
VTSQGAILVVGATSNAGKSNVVAALWAERRMNPVLLRPGRDESGAMVSEAVVLGESRGVTTASDHAVRVEELRETVLDSLDSVRGDFDLVVLEARTGLPVLGMRPHLGFGRLWSEDSLDTPAGAAQSAVDDADLDAQFDLLADWVGEHLDLDALLALAGSAVPVGEGPGWR